MQIDKDLIPEQTALVGRVASDLPEIETAPADMISRNNKNACRRRCGDRR